MNYFLFLNQIFALLYFYRAINNIQDFYIIESNVFVEKNLSKSKLEVISSKYKIVVYPVEKS